jgi:hypothetical protein
MRPAEDDDAATNVSESHRRLDRPVFVVGNPRSGTTLVRTYLERSATFSRLGRESRFIWDRFTHPLDDRRGAWRAAQRDPSALDAASRARARATLTAAYLRHASPGPSHDDPNTAEQALYRFAERLAQQGTSPWYYDLPADVLASRPDWPLPEGPVNGRETPEIAPFTPPPPAVGPTGPDADAPGRLLDKDTGHVWRLPLLDCLFPDARFVFVTRDGRATVSSLIEAWRHPRWFFSYRMPDDVELDIEGYSDRFAWGRRWWNLHLPSDWPDLVGRPLQDVCARVWSGGNAEILAHAGRLRSEGRAIVVRYEDLTADPARVMEQVAETVDIDPASLRLGRGYQAPAVVTDSPPGPHKWHRNADLVRAARGELEEMQLALGYPVAS